MGIVPKITDAELIVLAVMQALLGHPSERRWLRYACKNLIGMSVNGGCLCRSVSTRTSSNSTATVRGHPSEIAGTLVILDQPK